MGTETAALVTGGTGFIGARLVDALANDGAAVRTCGRSERPEGLSSSVDYQQADLAGDEPLAPLLDGVDVVYHVAGAASSTAGPEQMETVNVTGTARLLEAALEAGVARVVAVSTSSVYGKQVALPQPVAEDADCHPDPGYAETKWRAEQVAWEYAGKGLPVAVLRPSTVFGPGAVKLVASTILDAAVERYAGLDTFAVRRDPVELRLVHVDDVVAACRHLAATDDAPGRAFNLTSGVYPSSHEVAAAVADALGLAWAASDEPEPGLPYERRAQVREQMLAAGMRPDILLKRERTRFLNKGNPNNRLSLAALEATGFAPRVTDIPAAIRDSVDWYRARRWIL